MEQVRNSLVHEFSSRQLTEFVYYSSLRLWHELLIDLQRRSHP